MSPYHAKGIRGFAELQKHEIVHLREKFDPATPDPVWIEALGNERDWLIVSGDAKITRNPVNRAAWLESRLTAFFFSEPWATDSFWKQCPSLVTWWPEIVRQARETPSGHGFLLPKLGTKLRQIYPGETDGLRPTHR